MEHDMQCLWVLYCLSPCIVTCLPCLLSLVFRDPSLFLIRETLASCWLLHTC
ncbi:hypothetical protein BC941DRAFT_512886, partial [Chlamydoabsidia padenii]